MKYRTFKNDNEFNALHWSLHTINPHRAIIYRKSRYGVNVQLRRTRRWIHLYKYNMRVCFIE